MIAPNSKKNVKQLYEGDLGGLDWLSHIIYKMDANFFLR